MVQSWNGGWNIWVYIESAWKSHIVLLYEWLQNYLKQKNPSEGSDVSSSKKWEQQICQQPQPLAQWQVSFFVKRLKSQGNNMLKKWVKCLTKTAEDSVKEATKRKQYQHILFKVQNTDLAARDAHYHATCRRDYTREDETRGNHQRH